MKSIMVSVMLMLICCMGTPSGVHGDPLEFSTALSKGMEPFYDLEERNGTPEATGMCLEIIDAFVKKAPEFHFTYELELIPFARVKEYLRNNIFQAEFCIARTAERETWYQYTDTPLYPVKFGILARADDRDVHQLTTYDEMARLGGTMLGVRGANALKVFQEQTAHLNIPVYDTPSVEQNLKMLLTGRGRYFVFNHYSLIDGAKKLGYQDNVTLLPLVVKETFHWLAFSKAVPQDIVQRANAVLHELQESGELQRIYEKYGTLP